ncbi:UDP-galactose transporter, putative [Plasmodium ovale wallikeri]|uniref:UDP-galactose transporter, putative n=1 Tax=Plasmodium ovale wallikeri TaxID=864142 RepID=A0A1A8YTQ0_PLAOA|nr:UDP-galactose transporter, putative [Plasmodium ovale wallikeri]SBT35471.1 UDP-galactose transporter, putative [Plasmodium ovale wallikeri]
MCKCICSLLGVFVKSKINKEKFTQDLKKNVDTYFLKEIMLISITYSVAMIATNYSLSHVNFPTQVLVKSGKMIPIVVGGYCFFGKKYPYYDYISVFLITSSLVIFNLLRTKTSKEIHQTTFGLSLLCISLLCDGLTGPRQDKLLSKYNVNSVNLMFFVNIFAFFFNLIASLIFEGSKPYNFLSKYPNSYYYILAFSISGTLGQFFVFYSLKVYGSLYTSLFTTLRKALSTVVSVYLFGHVLKPIHNFPTLRKMPIPRTVRQTTFFPFDGSTHGGRPARNAKCSHLLCTFLNCTGYIYMDVYRLEKLKHTKKGKVVRSGGKALNTTQGGEG